MKYRFLLYILILSLFSACKESVEIVRYSQDEIAIFPDYKDVTIPYNIAPLCFSVEGDIRTALIVKGENDSITMTSSDGNFNIPKKKWRNLLERTKGKDLQVTISRELSEGWEATAPFSIHVSEDAIDPYLVYRRINPGYGLWNRMGLYQRCLEDFEEDKIYDNSEGRGNCINCHSFCNGNPEKWQVHIRARYGGTYLFDEDVQSTLKLKDKSKGNPVYPSWHPDGELIAYSNNKTFFFIHTTNQNRWEVMDDGSDVFVADIKTGEQYRSPLTSSDSSYETFPCFSPDGKSLFFCSAETPSDLLVGFDSIQYNICRIEFDASLRAFGERVDTIYNAKVDGGSASFPRISPDGRWLCFTRSQYGNFSICHRDADLCLIDLSLVQGSLSEMPAYTMLEKANSDQVDSYHSWSRNSRWIVFSSKRDDSIYTKPYFAHVDSDGNVSKAFVLPQRNAKNHYDLEMDSYNIPELISGKIDIERIKLDKSQGTPNPQEVISVN